MEGVGAVVMMAGLVVLGVSLRWWWSISRGTPSGDRTITAAGLGLMLIVVGIWIQVATG